MIERPSTTTRIFLGLFYAVPGQLSLSENIIAIPGLSPVQSTALAHYPFSSMTDRDGNFADERAPLVTPDHTDGNAVDSVPVADEGGELDNNENLTESKSSWYLFLLTLSIGG